LCIPVLFLPHFPFRIFLWFSLFLIVCGSLPDWALALGRIRLTGVIFFWLPPSYLLSFLRLRPCCFWAPSFLGMASVKTPPPLNVFFFWIFVLFPPSSLELFSYGPPLQAALFQALRRQGPLGFKLCFNWSLFTFGATSSSLPYSNFLAFPLQHSLPLSCTTRFFCAHRIDLQTFLVTRSFLHSVSPPPLLLLPPPFRPNHFPCPFSGPSHVRPTLF